MSVLIIVFVVFYIGSCALAVIHSRPRIGAFIFATQTLLSVIAIFVAANLRDPREMDSPVGGIDVALGLVYALIAITLAAHTAILVILMPQMINADEETKW